MREGVLCWYPFEKGANILDLTGGILTDLLKSKGEVASDGTGFDYAVVLDPTDFGIEALKGICSKLNEKGRLLFAYENPFALRYWSGKGAPNTDIPYETLFGKNQPSKAELKNRLKSAGFEAQKWYYPLTDHWLTQEVYSEDYLPNEFLNQRFDPYIAYDPFIQFDERSLYREVIRGGAFEFMCGAYLVEARVSAAIEACKVDYAAVTAYREPSKRFATVVRNDNTVRKQPLHPDGIERVKNTARIHGELRELGVNVIETRLDGDSLVMPRLHFPVLWDYWADKLSNGEFSEDEMFSQFDRIRDAIYKSSANGKCYWELVPANCFYDKENDELIFFDQEYCWENTPPEIAVARAVMALSYSRILNEDTRLDEWLNTLKKRYAISEKWDELFEYADIRAYKEVFGYEINEIKRLSECVNKYIEERVLEHEYERIVLLDRYNRIYPAAEKLKELGFKSPAIYGFGVRGKVLRTVLEVSGIDIPVIVDRNIDRYKTIDDAPNNYDVLIVSILRGEDIAAELRAKVSVPVITLGELIGEKNE